MNTMSDLRRSLEETAHHYDAPDPHELLRGVQDNIATGRYKDSRTPRLVAAAAAVALVAGGGWALSQGLGDDEETSTIQPADPAWELVDGAPPEYAGGLALVDTLTLGAEPTVAEVTSARGGQSYAVVWCDVAPETATTLSVAFWNGAEGPDVGCANGDGSPPGGPVSLPSLEDDQSLAVKLLGADGAHPGDLTSDDTVVVGFYREAAAAEFPYPEPGPVPDPPAHDVVLDAATPQTTLADLDHLGGAATGYLAPAVSVASHDGTALTTWAGEPGRLLVAVNGTVITNDGEHLAQPVGPGPWQEADPDLRGGYWHTWAAGVSTREFDLSPAGLAAHGIQVGEGDTVTVVARAAFPHDAWQVGIDQPEGTETAELREIGPTEQLPELAYGMRIAAAFEVPADGATHLLDLGDVDLAQVLWVPTCAQSLPGIEVTIGTRPTYCSQTAGWVEAINVPELAPGAPVEVSVSVGSHPVQLGAYLPQEWEDYPFAESATPLADDAGFGIVLSEQPANGSRPEDLTHSQEPAAVYREVATVSTGDLDSDGRAEVIVPSSTDLSVWVETSGVARVKLEIDGTSVEEALDGRPWPAYPVLRDGWLSAWTTGDSGTEMRFDRAVTGSGERDNPTVTVQVEAQEGAEVELTFFEFVPEEDFEG